MLANIEKNKLTYVCNCGQSHEVTLFDKFSSDNSSKVIVTHPCLKCNKQLFVKVCDENILMADGRYAELQAGWKDAD